MNSPLRKGKYRLAALSLRFATPTSGEVLSMKDGRRFHLDPDTGMQHTLMFLGEYEREVSNAIERLVKPGDVCLDVGANFGWFTTLFQRLGAGEIHAFEPVPRIFEMLRRNVALQSFETLPVFHQVSLGELPGLVELFLFENLPDGHASMSAGGGTVSEQLLVECVPLDNLLPTIGAVDIVKVDIEGAELMFLKGAELLFRQPSPPILVMEMAVATSRHFGHTPNDLIEFIGSRHPYYFYALDPSSFTLTEIQGFRAEEIGANVVCIPVVRKDRLQGLKIV